MTSNGKTLTAEEISILQSDNPDILDLATVFINANSISGNEKIMAEVLSTWFEARDYHVEKQPCVNEKSVDDVEEQRFNIFAYPKSVKDPKKDLRLVFNTHIDVVPPWFPAYIVDPNDPSTFKDYWTKEKIEQHQITTPILAGRGATDTKTLSSSMCLAVATDKRLEKYKDKIGFMFVVSEETTHAGMIEASRLECCNPEFMVVGEPTMMKIMRFQKGLVWINVSTKGRSCHSGYPELGISATDRLRLILNDIQEYPWPKNEHGITTINIGFLEGGQAVNALAEHAKAQIMFRLVSDEDEVVKVVQKICEKHRMDKKWPEDGGIKVEVICKNPTVDFSGHVDKWLAGDNMHGGNWEFGTACFNTDIPYYDFDGKAILTGHGDIMDAHCDREHIKIKDLRTCVKRYADLALQLLELPEGSGFE